MATITSFLFLRHLRGEPTAHQLFFRDGAVKKSGRGLSFWFSPLGASLAEIPLDDRELPFLFHGGSADFQDVTVQGILTFRVISPEVLAQRVDFAVDSQKGTHVRQPLDKLATMLTERAQELAMTDLARTPLRGLLSEGAPRLRDVLHKGLTEDEGFQSMGLSIVSVRVASVKPTADMERALQMPTREAIQQQADEATFARRALAVEKERAIAENELMSKIELSRKEERLIEQQGQNERKKAQELAEAQRIAGEAAILQKRALAAAESDSIGLIEGAKVTAERDRMAIYRDLPPSAMMGLAARELAVHLPNIQHLSLSPDTIGPMLTRVLQASATQLEKEPRR